jgi:hypothetical protein
MNTAATLVAWALISVLGLVIVMAFFGMFVTHGIPSPEIKKPKPPKPENTKSSKLPRAIARKKKA